MESPILVKESLHCAHEGLEIQFVVEVEKEKVGVDALDLHQEGMVYAQRVQLPDFPQEALDLLGYCLGRGETRDPVQLVDYHLLETERVLVSIVHADQRVNHFLVLTLP